MYSFFFISYDVDDEDDDDDMTHREVNVRKNVVFFCNCLVVFLVK